MRFLLANWLVIDIHRPRTPLINHANQITNNKHILVACFPKSGSTYLTTLLREITGFSNIGLAQYYGHNEQDIFKFQLEKYSQIDSVTHQHVKGTENNLALIKEYHINTVVLTRNIFDVILSVHDHIEREDHRVPAGYIHKEYFNMNKEEKLMFLIRILLPWYFNFYISWHEASQETNVLWTSYEELFSDQVDTITKILSLCSIPSSIEQIETAISMMASKNTRLNVGKSRRGETLPDSHKEAIVDLARVWKVDNKVMKAIGIDL